MKIAILGFGTVGSGAYEVAKATDGIEVVKILERRTRPEHPEATAMMTTDIDEIVKDPEIDLVAECMGGIDVPFDFVTRAMKNGKHVVTPNKNLVSAKYKDLVRCAEENGVEFRFTPAAGGGIPWLFNLQRQARCDEMTEVFGIVNGTCNYILDNMYTNGSAFDDVLKEAQSLGYAEADPASDIKGTDTLRKCVISANIAFSAEITEEDVPVFGIDKIGADDIRFFKERDLVCKLIMHAGKKDGRLFAYVEPVLFGKGELEANVATNNNLITLIGKNVGRLSFYGQGAGKMPTGTSVIHDVLDIAEKISFKRSAKTNAFRVDNEAIKKKYYFHLYDVSSLPDALIDEMVPGGVGTHIITIPLTVAEAHAIAKDYDRKGDLAFMAGLR